MNRTVLMSDEELKENFQRICLPENDSTEAVMSRIGSELPRRRASRLRRRAVAVVLAVVLLLPALTLGIGFFSPTVASALQRIPVLGAVLSGTIFDFAGDAGVRSANGGKAARTTEAQATDQGVTLTIRETMYDGVRLVLGYTLESDNGSQGLVDFGIYANGKRLFQSSGSGRGGWIDGRTYAGVISIMLREDEPKPPDSFTLRLETTTIFASKDNIKGTSVEGSWNLEVPIVRSESRTFLTPGAVVSSGGTSVEVKSVTFGQSATELRIDSEGNARSFDYQLVDDRGKVVETLSKMAEGVNGKIESRFLYAPIDPIPPFLVLKPLTWGKMPEETVFIRKPYTGEFPVVLPQGELGSVIVTGVEFLPDKTLIRYEVEGSDSFAPFWMEKADGERIVNGYGERKRTEDTDRIRYVMTYPPLDPKAGYVFGTIEPPGRFIEPLQVTIPLNSP